MKAYLLGIIALFPLVFSTCSSDEPESIFEGPYLYIHSTMPGTDDVWVIVTNGKGKVVGYQRLDESLGDVVLTEQDAPIQGRINIYVLNAYDISADKKGYAIDAALGVEPGMHYYRLKSTTPSGVEYKDLNARLYGVPVNSSISGTQLNSTTIGDGSSSDGTLDQVTVSQHVPEGMAPYYVGVYTHAAPKYALLDYGVNTLQEFNYPDDLQDFETIREVPMNGTMPGVAVTAGMKDGHEVMFMLLVTPSELEKLDTDESVKFCYIPGFDSYLTQYFSGGNGYSKRGTIPSVSQAIIPNQDITITSTKLRSFAATASDDIDYRNSLYYKEKTGGGKTHRIMVNVFSELNEAAQFDLKLPDEILALYNQLEFNDLALMSNNFFDLKGDATYTGSVDILFNKPGSAFEPREYYYYGR